MLVALELRTGKTREWLLRGRNLATVCDLLQLTPDDETAEVIALIEGLG